MLEDGFKEESIPNTQATPDSHHDEEDLLSEQIDVVSSRGLGVPSHSRSNHQRIGRSKVLPKSTRSKWNEAKCLLIIQEKQIIF